MIAFNEAARIVQREAVRLRVETVPLARALGRALAEEVRAAFDSPPFDRSAMDGFAIRSADTATTYRIVDTVAAGDTPGPVGAGECARIMTGAMLPAGADRVIRLEYVRESGDSIHVVREEKQSNVVRRGEGHRAGDRVLTPRGLEPQDVGILASLGRDTVTVSKRPVVAVLTTGSELRAPGAEVLDPGAIYDSNGPQLCAQIEACGSLARPLLRVGDDPGRIGERVAEAADCDLLIVSGGVSKGSFDYVPGVLERSGFEILFHHVAVRPGMPTLFGRRGEARVFGLPGNAVSTFVVFHVLVRPLLRLMQGLPAEAATVRARLGAPVRRRQTDRVEFLPVALEEGVALPVAYHGSSDLTALGEATGLLRIEAGVESIAEGTTADVLAVRGRW